jgi:tetratricopeptide (TPR) repeat protein
MARTFAELTRTHLVEEQTAGRFTFHDLLRAYAAELAEEDDPEGDRNQASRRLFDYYLQSAGSADHLVNPNRDPIDFEEPVTGVMPEVPNDLGDAMAWFAAERQVLLAAIAQNVDSSLDRHKLQLAWTLADFLERQAHWHDQAATQETAIAIASRLNEKDAQGRAHAALAAAQTRLGSYDEAINNFQQARELYDEIGDRAGQASIDLEITNALDAQERREEALRHAREAWRIYGELGHPAGQAYALNAIGWCQAMLGDYGAAVDSCKQALLLFDEIGGQYGSAATLDTAGFAYHNLGQFDEAISSYAHALAAWQDVGDRLHEADTLVHLGDTHSANGNFSAARYSWQQSLAIFEELGRDEVETVSAKLSELTNAK